MSPSKSLETIRREIANLLANAVFVVVMFAAVAGLHFMIGAISKYIDPGSLVIQALYFVELALFGLNAFVAIVVTLASAWRVIRAAITDVQPGEKR